MGLRNSHNFGECDVPDGLSHVTAKRVCRNLTLVRASGHLWILLW